MLSNLQKLAARQSRYDGLVQWHVPNIIAYIPLILQISSLFLFAGIIIMLLDVSKAMAIIVMVPTIGGLVLILIFTLLPPVLLFLGIWLRITGVKSTWFGQCPFKTPLGWMFTRTVLSMCLYFTPQRSDAHGDIAAMKPHIGSLSWTMCDIPFCSGPRYSDSIVKYIAGIFSSIRSRTLIEFLRQLDWSISLQVVKEVLKSMQTLDPGSDNLNHSDVERGRMAYLNGGAVPLDMLDAFIQGLEQIDDPETKLQKRVVEVCAMLLRRGAPPNNAKIKFCLPICEKIIRAAHDGGELYQDLKRSTIRIQEFLSHSELLDRLTEKLVNRGGGTRGRGTRRRRLGAMNDADMDRNEEGSEAGVEPKVGDTKGAHEARSDGEKAGNIEEWGKDEEVEE
ncbi:hypothetical protein VNI00_005488 [Paramarasmius palmivorus]|uniref:DUF6535 domain-containing protein n=1 Tax=Paramarasmius palmivorus TaxID=297713 RepID=A0AAW0DFG4_9AGAR